MSTIIKIIRSILLKIIRKCSNIYRILYKIEIKKRYGIGINSEIEFNFDPDTLENVKCKGFIQYYDKSNWQYIVKYDNENDPRPTYKACFLCEIKNFNVIQEINNA